MDRRRVAAGGVVFVALGLAFWLAPAPDTGPPVPEVVRKVETPVAPRKTTPRVATAPTKRTERAMREAVVPVVPEPTGPRPVRVRLAGGDRGAMALVEVRCGSYFRGFEVTGEQELTLPPEPCVIAATRKQGALVARAQEVLVGPDDGDTVELVFPDERVGGIGMGFGAEPWGMRVMSVMEGLPADVAGLEAGDLITEIDGVSIAGLPMEEMQELMTGPEGSTVRFTVSYGDEVTEVHTVTRAFLEAQERP